MNPPDDERVFLQQIAENPTDIGPRLVYADWLDDHNDPRAKKVRDQCKARMPLTRAELKHLFVNRDSLPAVPVEVEAPPDAGPWDISDGDRPNLEDDLQHLSVQKIGRNFPRDDRGKLALKTTAILSAYRFAESANVPSNKDLCLAAVGPERRKDEQLVRVQLIAGNVMNYDEGWIERPDYWNEQHTSVPGLPFAFEPQLQQLAPFADSAKLSELRRAQQDEELTILEKQALTILLLDHACFEEAMQLWDISVSPEVTRILNLEVFSVQGDGGCDCQYEMAAPLRGALVRRALWQSAPWNFEAALKVHERRANSRRRNKKPGALYLFILPKQIHSRRARLTVGHGLRNDITIDVRFSGSNVRPWRWTWTRPIEFDAARASLPGS